MSRGSLALVLLTAVVGLTAGLYYAWVVNPVRYVRTAPASLRLDFQEDYLALIASAYAATGDLLRAQTRLALLPDLRAAEELAALAQRRKAAGRPEAEVQALARLAAALGERPATRVAATTPLAATLTSHAPGLGTPSPTATRTNTPAPTTALTPTPKPTLLATATATPRPSYSLLTREKVCDASLSPPLIQVEALDAQGAPAPGAEALVVWDEGQDHFFTGLKPELGLGYGDFAMQVGTRYTVQLVGSQELVTGLKSESCLTPGAPAFPGSWVLRYQQNVAGP